MPGRDPYRVPAVIRKELCMDFKQKEKIYLSPEKIKEMIKDLKPGTMVTFEMPEISDGDEQDRKKEGKDTDGRSV